MLLQILLQTLTQRTRPFSMNQQNLGESRKYGIIDKFSKHIFGLKDSHAAHIDLWSYFCRFPGNRSPNMNFRALLMFFSSHESTGIHLDNRTQSADLNSQFIILNGKYRALLGKTSAAPEG